MRNTMILGIIVVVCFGLATFHMTRQVAASGPPIPKPFTASVHEVRFRADGVAAHEETYIVAFRADGSNVTDYHHILRNGETTEIRMIADVSSGHRVAVDYATQSTSTYPLESRYATLMAEQASACKAVGESGEPVLGYQVVLVHDGHTYANGMRNVHDRWEAPALNCFALRSVDFATRRPGTQAPHNEAEATNIILGEPDPTLFSIPQNFVERSPSERHAEFERRFGMSAPTPPQADEEYFSSRQRLR